MPRKELSFVVRREVAIRLRCVNQVDVVMRISDGGWYPSSTEKLPSRPEYSRLEVVVVRDVTVERGKKIFFFGVWIYRSVMSRLKCAMARE